MRGESVVLEQDEYVKRFESKASPGAAGSSATTVTQTTASAK
jgi:hypothetical protein